MNRDSATGKEYWRSLDDLADTPEFREFVHREFPSGASELNDPLTRRKFLSLMGASMALAGLAGCRKPVEMIIPYVAAPEEIVPGVANYYATTMPFGNDAFGLIVESHEGRPTKIEGNPGHPSTLGKSNTLIQASILGLYDPDRSRNVMNAGATSSWDEFVTFWRGLSERFRADGGQGLAVLSDSFSSPTLARLAEQFASAYPASKWATYEPVSDENIHAGVQIATGKKYQPIYDFEAAKVILSLDSDFVYTESDNIRNSRGFVDGRRVKSESDEMNRLYMVEGVYSLTGAMADHRLRLPSSMIGAFAAALAVELRNQGLRIDESGALEGYAEHNFDPEWLRIAASDLLKAQGQCIVIAGRRQPANVQSVVVAINGALGNVGKTIQYREMTDSRLSNRDDLAMLAREMKAGSISTLVILGGNPVYNAPGDLDFESALKNVEHTVHLSAYPDETSKNIEWHVNQAHYLESWGDARSIDGTASIIQPLIAPLFNGISQVEMLNLLTTGDNAPGYDIVRETWMRIIDAGVFESAWRKTLHDGFLKTELKSSPQPQIDYAAIFQYLQANPMRSEQPNNLEVVFMPSTKMYDGRFANNGWLQELPDTQTKITWDNAALISPKTAKELQVGNEEMANLHDGDRSLAIPVWILPGMADNMVALTLGFGRTSAGKVGNGVGFDTYRLRTTKNHEFGPGLKLEKIDGRYKISQTQNHHAMEGRPIVREATLQYYRENPEFAIEMVEVPPLQSLWTEHTYKEGYQWGMSIDLNACIGCNACTIACQSENNIPIVGKEQVARGREMHWIRVDRYFEGDLEDPEIVYQPVPCMHCENAPCEQVCPVNAAVHDHEGLNLQVYNRCIGTRYCSNNCPYKVRRFNFFSYTSKMPEVVKMAQNPDVTVRSRGVMEKCTYCLQRIARDKIKAKNEGREISDGEVISACAQTCPTDAIVFGNVGDPNSRVAKMKKQNRNYAMLAEYNTRPRTTYLARLRNPHPELELLEKERASQP